MDSKQAEHLISEVRRIRDLLELLAEPAVAQRDAKLRDELRRIVGASKRKQDSVLRMDGSQNQAGIASETKIHKGELSVMVGKLEQAGLLADGKKLPRLAISIPTDFFDGDS